MRSYLRKIRVPHKVTKLNLEPVIPKKRYELSETQKVAKMIAAEIGGLAPYEIKALELMKTDELKRAKKYLKIRLGSWARAEAKFNYLLSNYR
ncbi:large subunit ribosomal protein L36e [Pancytospora epiphaga]|nr:large subunit ribosomal protein L36e [Pancytospora epiphaga]